MKFIFIALVYLYSQPCTFCDELKNDRAYDKDSNWRKGANSNDTDVDDSLVDKALDGTLSLSGKPDTEENIFVDGDAKDCPPLFVTNGKLSGRLLPDHRETVQYTCDSGFVDIGNGELRCLNDQWYPPPKTICLRTCPALIAPSMGALLLEYTPATTKSDQYFVESTQLRVTCRSPDFRNKYTRDDLLTCNRDGNWVLVGSNGKPVRQIKDVDEMCELNRSVYAVAVCPRLSAISNVSTRYKKQRSGGGDLSVGDEAILTCNQRGYYFRISDRLSQIVLRCGQDGKWKDSGVAPVCYPSGCPRPVTDSQLKFAFEDQSNAVGIFSDDNLPLARYGARIFYKCEDQLLYYLVGDREFFCANNGSWVPSYWPHCELKRRCAGLDYPMDGYYNANPKAESFEPGQQINFGCTEGYRLDGHSILKCLDSGDWNLLPPSCVREEWSTKRFIAVASVACLLGVLLMVLLAFFLQRQFVLRKARAAGRRHRLVDAGGSDLHLRIGTGGGNVRNYPQLLASAGRNGPAAFDSDPDRLALIAFVDGVQVPLPTYEEAVNQAITERRCRPPPFDAVSTLSGYCSRAVRRLPSLSSLRSSIGIMANAAPNTRLAQINNAGSGNQRTRLREQWSSASGSNVSAHSHVLSNRHIGSNETVAVSDASTNVTLETVSTGDRSHTASARAYAGSLSSIPSSGGGSGNAVVNALSACSASSVDCVSNDSSQSQPADAGGSHHSDDLPLLESQELNESQEDVCETDQLGRRAANDESEEISSQKSLNT